MTTDKNGHEITSEDVEELENKLAIAVKALEVIRDNALNPAHTMTKFGLEQVTDANRAISDRALKEIQQRDLPDFARFENRSNITTDVDK